jgi:hypothetical protein
VIDKSVLVVLHVVYVNRLSPQASTVCSFELQSDLATCNLSPIIDLEAIVNYHAASIAAPIEKHTAGWSIQCRVST